MISLFEIAQNMNEADDDRYVSIGYGRYKEKGKEDDDNADVYVKTDSGKFVKSSDQKSDDDGGKPEEPKGKSLGKGDFERDFDDTAGDPDDSWDDEEGRAKPTGKTDADTDDDDEPKDSEVNLKNIDSFDDAKEVIDNIEDRKSEASEMEGNFYTDSEFRKVNDALPDDETKDEFFDHVKGNLMDRWTELSDLMGLEYENAQEGFYDDDENNQKKTIQQLKKDTDKLSNDAKQFIDNPKKYLKKLINSFDSKDESIKVINGKKYKAIKESKENPQLFKEIYERTFRSLK